MQRIQKQKRERRELIRKKKFHRSQERSKVSEADIEYLKQQMRDLREPYSTGAGAFTGATLDLSIEAMQLSEIQLEQQIAQQMAAVESGMEGTGVTGSTEGAAVATGVDITI